MFLFTKQEHSLIFSALKKSSFLKPMLLLIFLIQWSWNLLNLFNYLMMLNKILIQWFWVDVTTKACLFHLLHDEDSFFVRKLNSVQVFCATFNQFFLLKSSSVFPSLSEIRAEVSFFHFFLFQFFDDYFFT